MYQPKKFEYLLGIPGLSDELLKNHFTLYEGYVAKTNALLEKLDSLESGTLEYSEMQRRFGWEWNGMRLHELYFENLTKRSIDPMVAQGFTSLREVIEKIYGSMEKWEKNFRNVGLMRGIGWAVLAYDPISKELFNVWINEHDGGHLAGATPLLVMDVFEHAYITDYSIKRAEYIEVFMKGIDWEVVGGRFLDK